MDLTPLLSPKSMAIIGVSDRAMSFGNISSLVSVESSIAERTYFVNPKREELHGKKVYKDLADLPEVPECIVICTPKNGVMPIMEQAGKMGVKAAVVFASGFSEEHNDESKQLEKDLVELCQKYDIRMMGPNCGGFMNNVDSLGAWGLEVEYKFNSRGTGIGLVSNSGAISICFTNIPYVKFSYTISCGNANATTVEDYFEFLIEDKNTKVVAAYIEGLKNPAKFVKCLKRAAEIHKPIVILKGGRSVKGAISTASHTGSMAGSAASFESIAKRFGVILADTLEDLLSISQTLAVMDGNYPTSANYLSFCTSGADATLSADLAEAYGVELPDIDDATAKILTDNLAGFAVAKNPLDATSDVARDFDKLNNIYMGIENADNIDVILYHSDHLRREQTLYAGFVRATIERARASGLKKPMFIMPNYEDQRNIDIRQALEDVNVSFLSPGTSGYSQIAKLSGFFSYKPEEHLLDVALPESAPKAENRVVLSEEASKNELAAYDIPVPKQQNVTSESELEAAVANIGFPLVMKINSPDIAHKTDAGGVALNIRSQQEAKEAYNKILTSCKNYKADAKIDGVLVQQMVKQGVEMILGVSSDPQFGPMLLVGMGGVFVEVFRDSALSPCPISKPEAMRMITGLKSYKLLAGYRGSAPCDVDALADLMVKLSQYAAENKENLLELDLNPVFVYPEGEGVMAADALVVRDK